jgi:hypothetical protein
MITEIILENSRLDIYEDIGLELNLAIDDIKDFSSRNTTYSKTITVPGNANNNKIFGHIYSLTNSNNYGVNTDNPSVGYNFDPTKQTNAKIFVNKIQVFKGVLRLLEIKINKGTIEYECAVFGELGGFASAIANKTLEDEEFSNYFSQYDQNWTETNIANSWDASGTGIVFPLIDYGNCKHPSTGTGNDYHMNAFRPAFFVHEMIDKIIDYSGYTYSSDFFNTSFFRSLIIPNNFANLEQVIANLLNAQAANITIDQPDELLTFNSSNLYQFTIASSNTFTFTGTTGTLGKFTFQGYGTVITQRQVNIKLYQNTTVIGAWTLADNDDQQTEFYINQEIEASLTNGDTFYVEVTTNPGSNPNYQFISENLMLDFNSDNLVPVAAGYGASLSMPNLLPKGILQKDLFISICRMFNLYVYEDKSKDKHIMIEPFIDFYQIGGGFIKIDDFGDLLLHGESGDPTGLVLLEDPVSNAIDWSDKVDYSQPISIKPMSELNARFYDFQYTEDDDFFNERYNKKYSESYGDRKEDTGFEFTKDRTNIDIIFSPSVLVKRTGDDKLCASIFDRSDDVEQRRDTNIRIMQFQKITGVTSWRMKEPSEAGSANVGPALTYYGYAGHLDHPTLPTKDINFGVPKELLFSLSVQYPSANLFTSFWGDYLAEIIAKDSKLLSCYLYLDLQDIYSLDFAKLILIDGALWRLNKVNDYNPSVPKTTQVELLRVIELTYA